MTVVPTVLSIAAGYCIFAGIFHLNIGLSPRPPDWLYITIALSSLAIIEIHTTPPMFKAT